MTTPNEELRKRAEAAPRLKEWIVLPARQDEGYEESHSIYMEGYGALGYWKGGKGHHTDADWLLKKEDAEFICAANPAKVIELLDRIDRLEAENEAQRKLLEQARETISAIDQQIDLAKYPHAPDDITLLDISKASLDAITDHLKGKNHG